MAASSQQSSDSGRQNWIQSFVALNYTKEGLEDFVLDEITQFQADILCAIATKNCLPSGSTCNSCTTANILPCKTTGYCTPVGRCQAHNIKDPARKSDIPCINNICKDLRDHIRKNHRFYQPNKQDPSWKNSDATKFCSDPFQILKCYLSLDGYTNVQTIQDTDFNGVINVIINCTIFQNKLAAKLFQKANIFVEAREIGRTIRHSANLTVSDTDLAQHIDTLIQVLSDPKYLILDNKAKNAVTKLKKLKINGLPLNAEENTRIADALIKFIKTTEATNIEMTKQIKGELHEEIQKLQKLQKSTTKYLNSYVKKSVQNIERASVHEMKKLKQFAKETKSKIQSNVKPFKTILAVKKPTSSSDRPE